MATSVPKNRRPCSRIADRPALHPVTLLASLALIIIPLACGRPDDNTALSSDSDSGLAEQADLTASTAAPSTSAGSIDTDDSTSSSAATDSADPTDSTTPSTLTGDQTGASTLAGEPIDSADLSATTNPNATTDSNPKSDSDPKSGSDPTGESTETTAEAPTSSTPVTATTLAPETESQPDGPSPRPAWLGKRTLPTTPDGLVVVPQTTPQELRDRRLITIDTMPPPTDDQFRAIAGPVPDAVLFRSTWIESCPVTVDELSYLTLTFWGFDGQHHVGEMIVNASQAENVISVFKTLHAARYPIEEMRVVARAELDADPTGDGNNTTAFVCRAVTGGSRFSEHAYGLAIDLNPFHNPYKRGDLILPELAVDYLDRSGGRAGVVVDDDVVVRAFAAIGWEWGGDWRSLKDYQHFALNNR